MTVLTLDLGTSATKAALWSDDGLVAFARAPLSTHHPQPDRAEQDPEEWWQSVVDACAELRALEPDAYSSIEALGCSAARETFACFDAELNPVSPGILWSDVRAVDEARQLGDPIAFRRQTGVVLTPSCCAAKMKWVALHDRDCFRDTTWFLSPRDFVLARVTGQVVTDPTLASRTGAYSLSGIFVGDDALGDRLPRIVSSLEFDPLATGNQLALPTGAVAIRGAGDRACEVIGVGASAAVPMVSWGTTANVSVPHPGPVEDLPSHGQVSRGAVEGFVIEAGLSIAGAALDWLTSLTGWTQADLLQEAGRVAPGAAGLLACPWLNGARAPWWRPDVRASFVGLSNAHGPPELARAVIESIALDAARCVEFLAPSSRALALAGRGADELLWRSVLAAAARRPVYRHRLADAASVGARLLVAAARGERLELDDLSPVTDTEAPAPDLVSRYSEVRETSDRVASGLLDSLPRDLPAVASAVSGRRQSAGA